MGMPGFAELFILLFVPLYLVLLALGYAGVTLLVLPYFSRITPPLRVLVKKYFLLVFLLGFFSLFYNFFIPDKEALEETLSIEDMALELLVFIFEVFFISRWIRDNDGSSFGLKIGLVIAVIFFIFSYTIDFGLSYLIESIYPS